MQLNKNNQSICVFINNYIILKESSIKLPPPLKSNFCSGIGNALFPSTYLPHLHVEGRKGGGGCAVEVSNIAPISSVDGGRATFFYLHV